MTTTGLDFAVSPGAPPTVVAKPLAGTDWLTEHRDGLQAVALEHGAVLVRGLGLRELSDTVAACRSVVRAPAADAEPFAPRIRHAGGVYSSAAWPPDQPMCMHHECSYVLEPPGVLAFCCLVAPVRGGATAIADAAAVLADLPSDLVARFEQTGWELTRHHADLVGMPWPATYGTADRDAVERHCHENGIAWEWTAGGGLRTRRRCPAVVAHPVSGQRLWFNQVAFLSEWTMEPAVREYLVDALGLDGLPFNTRFGDGEPLERETVELVHAVYAGHARRVTWQAGDLLIVDNLRTAHSREPFAGQREIVVGMGDPVRLSRS